MWADLRSFQNIWYVWKLDQIRLINYLIHRICANKGHFWLATFQDKIDFDFIFQDIHLLIWAVCNWVLNIFSVISNCSEAQTLPLIWCANSHFAIKIGLIYHETIIYNWYICASVMTVVEFHFVAVETQWIFRSK